MTGASARVAASDRSSRADALLAALGRRPPTDIACRDVAVVVAHPDDETLGCGAALARMRDVRLAVVTTGAPRNGADAHRHGFDDADAYAAARAAEMRAALTQAEVDHGRLSGFGIADQEAAFHLTAITTGLADLFRQHGIRVALTHAYEGGHPDHDATAFAVKAATALLAGGGTVVEVIEMPFYRLGPDGWLRQCFVPRDEVTEVAVSLSPEAVERKRRMLAAHATQRDTLASFSATVERFRRAPAYDFSRLPNEGQLLYARYDWGLSGSRWPALVADACGALQLPLRL